MIEDDVAWPVMVSLAACLCTSIEEAELPTPCACGVIPGPAAILDFCGACKDGTCGGQAWVRMVTEFPSQDFPTQSQVAQCVDPLAFTLELGISRCLPTGNMNAIRGYTPPSLEQMVEATRLQMADKRAMYRAIQCCFAKGEYRDRSYAIGTYSPLQVSGDCGGGIYQVTVWSQ